MPDWLLLIGAQLLERLPHLALWLVAIVLAASRRDKHPSASKLLVAGAAVCLAVMLAGSAFAALPLYLHRSGRSMSEVGALLGALSLATSIVSVAGLGLVVAAVFANRRDAATRTTAPPGT